MSAVVLNESTQAPVVVYTGVTQPSLYYKIVSPIDGSPVNDIESGVFYMRPLESRNPVVSSAAVPLTPPDNDGNNIRYDWQSADIAVEGPYMGWWGYTESGQSQAAESEEFRIVVTDHGPGFGVESGAIIDGVSMYIPLTLARLREEPSFGDRWLQQHSNYVQQIVMGNVLTADQEISYNPFLLQYLSKRVALRLIPPARDYWGRQPTSILVSGPAEQRAFPDELQNLTAIEARLAHELPGDWRQLQAIVPTLPQLRREPMPLSSLDQNAWSRRPVSKDPYETRRPTVGGPWFNPWFEF